MSTAQQSPGAAGWVVNMRKALMFAALVLAPALTGCTIADWCFVACGSAYSGGDSTSALDRKRDFDARVQASQAAGKYGTEP